MFASALCTVSAEVSSFPVWPVRTGVNRDSTLTFGPCAFARRRRTHEGTGGQCQVCAKRSCPRPLPAPSQPPQALALPFAPPYPERHPQASPVPYRDPSSAACRHGTPQARSWPPSASSHLQRRCVVRSSRMPLLWPALPAFLLLARVIAAPRFPQIVGAAVPLFSPTFVGLLSLLALPPLTIALSTAVCTAALHCKQR